MSRMMMSLIAIGLTAACGISLSAQTWMDGFDYPAGPVLGTWTQYRSPWIATGSAAQADARSNYQYCLQEKRVFRDCAVQCEVICRGASVQLGGVVLRCNDPNGGIYGADMLLAKVQGSGSGFFTSVWFFEVTVNGTSYLKELSKLKPFTRAMVRMLAVDDRITVQVDAGSDGTWDHEFDRTLRNPPKSGPVGFVGYNGVLIDNFALFDAIAYTNRGGSQPQPGKSVFIEMKGVPNGAYVAASALDNPGIPLGPASAIPLAPDGLFFISLQGLAPTVFQDFYGRLSAAGAGRLTVTIPPLPALIGVTFFTAFVNLDATGVTAISNDHRITIES